MNGDVARRPRRVPPKECPPKSELRMVYAAIALGTLFLIVAGLLLG